MKREWRLRIRRIEGDREHGASVLAAHALGALEDAWREAPGDTGGECACAVADLARALGAARPSMPVLENGVNLAMRQALADLPGEGEAARERGARAARQATEALARARAGAARHAAGIARGVVLTHSASETTLKALRAAARAGHLARVIATESRPGDEGRAVAKALAEEGVPVTFVVDAAMGLHAREADLLLVGADAVLPDGSIVNKIGTRLLALAGAREGIPLHVVADTFKVSARESVPLEEKAGREVWARPPRGVSVRNLYFDRTPPDLVSGIVTEDGVLPPASVQRVAEAHAACARWESRVPRTTSNAKARPGDRSM